MNPNRESKTSGETRTWVWSWRPDLLLVAGPAVMVGSESAAVLGSELPRSGLLSFAGASLVVIWALILVFGGRGAR